MGLFKLKEINNDISASSADGENTSSGKSILLVPSGSDVDQTALFDSAGLGPTTKAATSTEVKIANNKTIHGKHINFLENFNNWAVSPILNDTYKNDIKIPAIHLKEYRLLESSLWNQVKYFAYIFQTNTGRAADKVKVYAGEETWLSTALETAQEGIDTTFSAAKGVINFLNIETPDFTGFDNADPYENLYSTTSTGFEYTFPLYTQQMKNQTANFSDSYSGDGKGALHTVFNNDIYNLENLANLMSTGGRALVEPGIFIEKTQFYDFGKNFESINFSFPLLNTISQEQINQNYQFLFLLLYQNTMFRKDRAAFIPPCIYEVLVPGIRYMKFAYISSLKIDFLGTRRMIQVDPGIGPTFKTIVPEAYDVNITIQNLHEENGNYIIRSAANSFDEVKIRDILPTLPGNEQNI